MRVLLARSESPLTRGMRGGCAIGDVDDGRVRKTLKERAGTDRLIVRVSDDHEDARRLRVHRRDQALQHLLGGAALELKARIRARPDENEGSGALRHSSRAQRTASATKMATPTSRYARDRAAPPRQIARSPVTRMRD